MNFSNMSLDAQALAGAPPTLRSLMFWVIETENVFRVSNMFQVSNMFKVFVHIWLPFPIYIFETVIFLFIYILYVF